MVTRLLCLSHLDLVHGQVVVLGSVLQLRQQSDQVRCSFCKSLWKIWWSLYKSELESKFILNDRR